MMTVDKSVKDKLTDISLNFGDGISLDYPAGKVSTIGAGGKIALCYMARSVEGLKEAVTFLGDNGINPKVIGNCSNILVADSGFSGAAVKLTGDLSGGMNVEGNIVEVSSGTELRMLINNCFKKGLSGMEGLVGIPGTVGGALINNASSYSAISDRLVKVLVMDLTGDTYWVNSEDMDFRYRASSFSGDQIILKAVFALTPGDPVVIKRDLKKFYSEKNRTQPLSSRSLGCIFKNGPDGEYAAGEVIDSLGLKGKRIGGAEISKKHANFIINTGGAAAADITSLMDEVSARSREVLSIELVPEIEII